MSQMTATQAADTQCQHQSSEPITGCLQYLSICEIGSLCREVDREGGHTVKQALNIRNQPQGCLVRKSEMLQFLCCCCEIMSQHTMSRHESISAKAQ